MQEIHFFQINALQIFCVYLDAERLYDHIKRELFQTCRLHASRESNERVKDTILVAHTLQIQVPARAVACVSFNIKQRKKLCACNVLVMPSVKAWSYQKGD